MITAILLAAGQSKRIPNENKLIKRFKNKPLINHILKSLIKSKINKIIIVLGYEHLKIKKVLLKSKKIIGTHWGTFVLSLEPIMEPPIRFKKSAEKYGFKKEDAIIFKIGEFNKLKDIIN